MLGRFVGWAVCLIVVGALTACSSANTDATVAVPVWDYQAGADAAVQ
jgi:hypothetical protein